MDSILRKAKKNCTDLLVASRCGELPFHNLEHTLVVYYNVKEIGHYENLGDTELEPILIAALFHDSGNVECFKDHEEISAAKAKTFLRKENYDFDSIQIVINCIMATKMPQKPTTIYERIICDADLFHLGRKNFYEVNEQLRAEWELVGKEHYTDLQWFTMNIGFLRNHDFHTNYGKKILEPVKQENIRLFESFILNMEYN